MLRKFLSSVLVVLVLVAPALGANKLYVTPETVITFADSAQTPTATITLSALATVTGRVSAQHDRGAGAHAMCYLWFATFQLTGTNVVGSTIDLYLALSDGTNVDGSVGTADAALASVNNLLALRFIGSLPVYQTTTNTAMNTSGFYCTAARYMSLVVYNATTLPLKTDTGVHKVSFFPMPMEIQ